jgi:hypothetical protein
VDVPTPKWLPMVRTKADCVCVGTPYGMWTWIGIIASEHLS